MAATLMMVAGMEFIKLISTHKATQFAQFKLLIERGVFQGVFFNLHFLQISTNTCLDHMDQEWVNCSLCTRMLCHL